MKEAPKPERCQISLVNQSQDCRRAAVIFRWTGKIDVGLCRKHADPALGAGLVLDGPDAWACRRCKLPIHPGACGIPTKPRQRRKERLPK